MILQNEVTFHVGESIIYPKKWQEPLLVSLICLSVLRLFEML